MLHSLEELFITKELCLRNKTALITGASSGIGRATAAWLAREGVNLILLARREEPLRALKNLLFEYYKDICIKLIICDVTNPDIKNILAQHGALDVDILINNAGLARGKDSVVNLLPEDLLEMINTNITAAFRIASAVATCMAARASGHIVNIGSIAGRYSYEGGSVYCATKFALRGFNEALRQEMHSKNVRVSLVSPGMVKTDFSVVRFKGDEDIARKIYSDTTALEAADVARLIVKIVKEPVHVSYDEVIILPTMQAPVSYKVHKNL
jgi:NADP-dependent 3-hydroxy acid dehydrogenase YdfG